MTERRIIRQQAGFPTALESLVQRCTYRPNWEVTLWDEYDRGQGSRGLTLVITTATVNAYATMKANGPEFNRPIFIHHLFIVPAAGYDERSWRRWLFECFHQVEFHECMEFFTIDGEKPYAPSHGPGNDPYLLREVGTELDVRTSFRGEVNP